MDCSENKKMCAEYHVTGYPTTLLLYNGKLIAKHRESRSSAIKIRSWIIRQLNEAHLREADILSDAEIESITKSKQSWNQPFTNKRNKQKSRGYFEGISSVSDIYSALLGDISPTIPFIIYLFGTLSGIIVGVCFVFCATN